MDGRRNNKGTKGNKGGRPPKADEIKLIEKLDKHIDSDMVFDKLEGLCSQNNMKAIELYLAYRYGKPKQSIHQTNINHNHEITREEVSLIKEELNKKY